MIKSIALVIALTLSGCSIFMVSLTRQRQVESAPLIGCPASEIEIINGVGLANDNTWIAICKSVQYACGATPYPGCQRCCVYLPENSNHLKP
jgi:hypothetical protein